VSQNMPAALGPRFRLFGVTLRRKDHDVIRDILPLFLTRSADLEIISNSSNVQRERR
jgi:hypothetical protein